jgi:hypothetical protein
LKLGRDNTFEHFKGGWILKYFKGRQGSEIIVQKVKLQGKEHLLVSQRFWRKKSNGRNSPWRTREVARIVGSRRVAGKLSIGSNRDLLVIDPLESVISEFRV